MKLKTLLSKLTKKLSRKQKRIILLLLVIPSVMVISTSINLLMPNISMRNEINVYYDDNLFGTGIVPEGETYMIEYYNGTWQFLQSGILDATGIVQFVPTLDPTMMAGDSYRFSIVGFSDAYLYWLRDADTPTEYVLDAKVVDVVALWDDMSVVEGYDMDISYWNGTDYVYLGTQTTDALGETAFSVIVGQYAFTSDLLNTTTVLASDVSVGVNVIISREIEMWIL